MELSSVLNRTLFALAGCLATCAHTCALCIVAIGVVSLFDTRIGLKKNHTGRS